MDMDGQSRTSFVPFVTYFLTVCDEILTLDHRAEDGDQLRQMVGRGDEREGR